ncbi:putative bifunctional diguanylate cyclase/phosphodiesterase [Pengzhenrongella sicca]|uniref:Bifunctional diguanylate cyclase/phosphodiesterase n=1 Tax=Pengzhenrongella sicca TaxID=2819238 RepID=A0A8A4ZDX5_9MICO|nr:bifunctional diguanylate cyclase/phosphodiesterase [Pengzhenrongella sicca]QTE30172.1 bifunctional diguanylate cyclase/phosphodiesterase [Pengzhenrongella sicca]
MRWLGTATWVVVALGCGSTIFLSGPPSGGPIRTALLVTLASFFLVLVARLLLGAVRFPERRASFWFLAAGVAMWAVAAATVSARQTQTAVAFPSPAEALYCVSYLGLVAFLLLDVPRRPLPSVAVWLEAAVVCGAAACLTTFVVLTPLAETFSRGGMPLLLALLYPLIDLILATVVLAQLMLRHRDWSLRALALIVGFVMLAVADSSFMTGLSAGAYTSSIFLDTLWGTSFAVIVAAACFPPRPAQVRPIMRQNGSLLPAAAALAVVVLVMHPDGGLGWYVMGPAVITLICTLARLILALREAQGAAEALRLSLTDELTGLPNRRALMAAADEHVKDHSLIGLLLLDLDGFKDVNDSLGHATGDDVLIALAQRLRSACDPGVLVVRLGGDEFALLVHSGDEVELLELAQTVRTVLQRPLRVDNIDLSLDASVGIAVRAVDDLSATELLRRADIAMYEAKESRAGSLLFDASQDGFARQRLRRGEELRLAIACEQIVVWYQPQVDARTRHVLAVEALVRWQHPTKGLLSPIDFLSDARKFGLMPALTDAVMRAVLVDLRRWTDEGFTFRAAMNCAPPELVGGTFLATLFAALEAAELPDDILLVEVTEDSFLADQERARDALYDLRAHHVQTSIDDYGTGFSSLAYLRDLPMSELKIDRSFVSTIVQDERSRMIVSTTTQMAHALGMRVVAEGVEDAATAAALLPLGIDLFQGYHIARPMPAAAVGPWVLSWTTDPARVGMPRLP